MNLNNVTQSLIVRNIGKYFVVNVNNIIYGSPV